ADHPSGCRRDQWRLMAFRRILREAQGRHAAVIGQAGIEHRDVAQTDPDAPERKWQSWIPCAAGENETRSSMPESCREFAGADRPDELNGRGIVGLLQRLPRRHHAVEISIEILRRIVAEPEGTVLDEAVWCEKTLVEGKGVDERLQRRAGRARRARHI